MLYGSFGLPRRNNMLFWFLVIVFIAVVIGAIIAGNEK